MGKSRTASAREGQGVIRIGISGWTYKPWRGVFYPEELAQKRELWYASRQLGGVLEINGTFYSLQRASSFQTWYEQTPRGFRFAVKGGRFITHMKRLNIEASTLANFYASGLLALREKLGPILWQLPPTLKFDPDRVEAFLDMLPRDTQEAARLARQHGSQVKDPLVEADRKRPLRYALEVRHDSFACDRFLNLLRGHGVALVVAETADKWLLAEDVTADFMYIRLHGAEQLYASGYTDQQLDGWAKRIRKWSAGGEPRDARRVTSQRAARRSKRDVFVFFDNTDVKLRAPFDAMALMQRLKIPVAADDSVDLSAPPKLRQIRNDT